MSEPPHRRRRCLLAAATGVPVVAVVAAGCAQIPSSSAVHTGRVVTYAGAEQQAPVGLIAALPRTGMTRGQVVTGFLRAQAVSQGDGSAARAYLTPAAAARWHPRPALVVYDDRHHRLVDRQRGLEVLEAARVGTISSAGRWTTLPGRLSERFRLQRDDNGQWRISRPPRDSLLGRTDLSALYSEDQLEFVSVASGAGVPVPVVEPRVEPGLATTLMRALLAGPPHQIAGAVGTAWPGGTQLNGNVVVDTEGTADVDLTSQVQRLAPARLRVAVDQALATLGRVPGVTAVRFLVDGALLSVPGVPAVQPVAAGRVLEPQGTAARLTVVRPSGHAVRLAAVTGAAAGTPRQQISAAASLGRRWRGLSQAAVSSAGRVLGVRGSGRGQVLVTGSLTGRPVPLARADSFGSLQWVGDQALAVVDGARVDRIVGHRLRPMHLPPWIARTGVRALAVAPDGTTLALLVGAPGHTHLLSGVLGPHGRLSGLARIAAGIRSMQGLAWESRTGLLSTAETARGRSELVSVDSAGFAVRRLHLPRSVPLPVEVCAAPGVPVAVVAGGKMWVNSAGRWTQGGPALDCSDGG